MREEKPIRITIVLDSETKFLFQRLGYINNRGRVIAKYGHFTEVVLNLIKTPFKGKDILELEFPRFLMIQNEKKIQKLREDNANLGSEILKVRDRIKNLGGKNE